MRRKNPRLPNLNRHRLPNLNPRRLHLISLPNLRFLRRRRRRHPVQRPLRNLLRSLIKSPKPHLEPAVKPSGAPNPHPGTAPGSSKGSLTGAPNGTGNGGPRSGLLIRSPRPPYPAQALQMHLSGDVSVRMTVQAGNIVDAEGSGPPMLASAAARWVRTNWKFSPTTNGTFSSSRFFRSALVPK